MSWIVGERSWGQAFGTLCFLTVSTVGLSYFTLLMLCLLHHDRTYPQKPKTLNQIYLPFLKLLLSDFFFFFRSDTVACIRGSAFVWIFFQEWDSNLYWGSGKTLQGYLRMLSTTGIWDLSPWEIWEKAQTMTQNHSMWAREKMETLTSRLNTLSWWRTASSGSLLNHM